MPPPPAPPAPDPCLFVGASDVPLDNTAGLSLNFTQVHTNLGTDVWYGFMFSANAITTLKNATLALEEDVNDAPTLTLTLWSLVCAAPGVF